MTPIEPPIFAGFNQWIHWALVERDGKQTKVPVSPSGYPIDAQDPANWLSFVEAIATGGQLGFVFTEADPFFFIDVDHAWDGAKWNAAAEWARSMLPGAVCELSQSRTGFHLFGVYTSVPPHSNRRKDLGIEFYTGGRFCAMTFDGLEPLPVVDLTAYIHAFAAHFPVSAASEAIEWTEAPDPTWTGPTDDTELLTKMLGAAGSARQAFGATWSFKELWEGAVPDGSLSEADAALCAHLAFWSGKDCSRMERLFSASALGQRDKWINRPDYRERTIRFAVGSCSNVYSAPPPASDVIDPLNPPTIEQLEATPALFTGGLATLSLDLQPKHFEGCVWISDVKRTFVPRGLLMDREQIDAVYGGYNFEMEMGSQDTTKSAFECFTRNRALRFPKVDSSAFRPSDPTGMIYPPEAGGGLSMVNTYTPAIVSAVPGDVSLFLDFMQRLLPGELNRDITLSYCRALVQNPGVKFQWCLFIQGVQGNGKTFLATVLAGAIGRQDYVGFPNARDVGNKFNANFHRKLLIVIEESNAYENSDFMEAMKPMITNSRLEFQPKGMNQFTSDNFANFILTSNHKDGILKTEDDRRYAPVYSAQQRFEDLAASGLTELYFEVLWDWYLNRGGREAVNYYLHTVLPNPAYNPAGSCLRAPITENTAEAIALGMSPAAWALIEAVESGCMGCKGPWISSAALPGIYEGQRGIDRRKIADALELLDYIKHPGIPDGRVTTAIAGEGRPRLFVKRGSPAASLRGNAVAAAYLKAQNPPMGELRHGT